MEVIALLVRLRACYNALRRDPPAALEAILALLVPPLLALTPISAFRPRRWRGALLPDAAKVRIEVLEAGKRPVSVVADHDEFRDLAFVDIEMDHGANLVLLHDPGHSLEERILREQFGY